MKKVFGLMACLALLVASCGGGGGSSSTPTSTSTKVAAQAATQTVMEEGGNALLDSLKPPSTTSVKTAYPISYTGECKTSSGTTSGTVTATGTTNATCTGTTTVTCTNVSAPVTVVFTDCAKYLEVDGTTYNVVLNGTATTTATGTVSGNETSATLNMSGTMAGTVTLTGDVAGTVDLSNVSYDANGTPPDDIDISCDGTAEVTIIDQPAQICTVADDCKGCTE